MSRLPLRAAALLAVVGPVTTAGCRGPAPATHAHRSPAEPEVRIGAPRVRFALPPVDKPALEAAKAPLSLVSKDGRALEVDTFEARAVVEGPLAFTEVRVAFDNPEDRVIEGTFRVVLPPGASLARLAMKIDDRWQEGEVVDKTRARLAYDDFLHRRQDPALLEASLPNEVSVRVFPIGARAKKELVVSWSHELTADGAYELPLVGLPKAKKLSVDVRADGAALSRLEIHDAAPKADVHVAVPGPQLALRTGDLAAVRVEPLASAPAEPLEAAVLLVDTSASRALGLDLSLAATARAVREIASASPSAHVAVAAFDQEIVPVYEGPAASFPGAALSTLAARGALGASDLGAAIAWAGVAARRVTAKRVVLVGDGVATAGATDRKALGDAVLALGGAGVERFDVIALGGLRDDALLARLTTMGLRRDGAVADATRGLDDVMARLGRASRSVDVKVDGARWQWPTRLEGVQPGEARYVYASVPAGDVAITMGPTRVVAKAKRGTRELVERSWATAKVASLTDREAFETPSPELRREVTALSLRHRLIGPYTSLIVLETEGDYARWGIDRSAPARTLTVERGAIAEYERTAPKGRPGGATNVTPTQRWGGSARPDPASATGNMWGDAIGDSFGAGGLGLSGIGEGGGGRGEGIGLGSVGTIGHGAGPSAPPAEVAGKASTAAPAAPARPTATAAPAAPARPTASHRTRPPTVRMGATQVSGRLPPEVIQRIVRQNFGRFRACYEAALRRTPTIEGRVVTRFMIDRSGAVVRAEDAGSSISDPQLRACVHHAYTRLSFPQPEGGVITVVYPIHLSNGDGAGSVATTPSTPTSAPSTAPSGVWRRTTEQSEPKPESPYSGPFADVMRALDAKQPEKAFEAAGKWRARDPGDVLALVALGESFEALGDFSQAARAYGSIIDLYASRADLRRFAGERLERVATRGEARPALLLAADTFEKARDDRPDHPSGYRLVAITHAKLGQWEAAFPDVESALAASWPRGRFPGVQRTLLDDLAVLGAAWMTAAPERAPAIRARLAERNVEPATEPSLRFVLSWETGANDVDFHVKDARGGHAFYGSPALPSGGQLYGDVTTGYGPECFAIKGPERSGPYELSAHYYSKGPMGYGMGKVEIMKHDGKGGLSFDERPFVVMTDRATVELGRVD